MNRKLAALLFVLCAAPALALDPVVPEKAATATVDSPAPAAQMDKPKLATASEQDLLVRRVFGILLGEIALQRNQPDVALGTYLDLVERSRDPLLIERASEIAIHLRQLEVALGLARRWVKLEPTSFKAHQTLTTVLLLASRNDELGDQLALMLQWDKTRLADNLLGLNRLLARVVEMRTDWERGVLLRVQVLAREAPGEAIELLQGFLGRDETAIEARMALARLLLTSKRYPESLQQFLKVIELAPDASEAIFPAAMLSLQQLDIATGRKLLLKLLEGNYSDKSSVRFFLGQIEEEQGKFDAALGYYREVMAGEQYLPARSRAAQLLVRQGKNDEALRLLHETEGKTAEEKSRLALAEINLLREAKRYAEAYARLDPVLKAKPDDVELLYEQAMLAERLGKPAVFEAHMRRVLELKPDHAHALNALAYTWADQNRRLDEAHVMLRKAMALAPQDPFIMDSLGWLLYRQGKLAEAVATLRAAYALRADPEIAAHLGEVLWFSAQREEATKLWRQAAEAHPENDVLKTIVKKFLP